MHNSFLRIVTGAMLQKKIFDEMKVDEMKFPAILFDLITIIEFDFRNF